MIGETLGSYRITGKIGEGGMGVVYLAEHPLIGRKAAIKLLLPEFSQNQEIVNRFFNEARATTMIKHPGLVDIFDFGYHQTGSAYIVMEFLDGESLSGLLRRERVLSPGLIVVIARQLASAIGAAHAKGIVHRDLKPDNIYLVPDRDVAAGLRVKVLDFGIAKLAAGDQNGMMKTRTGSMMGTPLYMSPEQCRGAGTVDHRADIYSLGCIMFEMSCGRVPFIGEGAGDLIVQHLREYPPSPSTIEPSVPLPLEGMILRMMAKSADDRQQNMEELTRELDALGSWRAPTSPPQLSPYANLGPPSRPGVRGTGPGGGPGGGGPGGTGPGQTVPSHTGQTGPGGTTVPSGPGYVPAVTATTLGSAASQIRSGPPLPAPGSKRWVLPVAAVVLVGGGLAAYLATRGKHPDKQVAAAVTAPPAPAPAADPPRPTPVPDAPVAAPAVPKIKLSITSEPAGAEVFNYANGVRIGKTPVTQEQAATPGDAVFVIKLAGYEDVQVTLAADKDGAQDVVLKQVVPLKGPEPIAKSGGHAHHDKKPAGSTSAPDKPATTTPDKPVVKKPIKDGTVDPFGDN